MPFLIQKTDASYTTTSGYVSLLKAKIIGRTLASIVIKNSHVSNTAKWKVLVSNDSQGSSTSFGELKAEASIAASTTTPYAITGSFAWIDIQVKDDSGHATMDGWIYSVGI